MGFESGAGDVGACHVPGEADDRTAGIRSQNRVGVGTGYSNGKTALSVGYQRAISDRATLTIGGAFSSGESSAGVGFGFGW